MRSPIVRNISSKTCHLYRGTCVPILRVCILTLERREHVEGYQASGRGGVLFAHVVADLYVHNNPDDIIRLLLILAPARLHKGNIPKINDDYTIG